MSQAKRPLKDATAVNATRWALYESLKATGLPVEVGSGGRTKFNRTMQHFSKEHWIDAACVGETGANVIIPDGMLPLLVKATGHGNRKMCYTDAYGFPTKHRTNQKFHHGFQTGDMVKAVIPAGKYAGEFTGRIMVRKRPCFALKLDGRQFDVHPKHLTRLHGADGYSYA